MIAAFLIVPCNNARARSGFIGALRERHHSHERTAQPRPSMATTPTVNIRGATLKCVNASAMAFTSTTAYKRGTCPENARACSTRSSGRFLGSAKSAERAESGDILRDFPPINVIPSVNKVSGAGELNAFFPPGSGESVNEYSYFRRSHALQYRVAIGCIALQKLL